MPRNDLTSYPKRIGYRKHSGMVAWLLHRITGVILALYFTMHILGSSGVCTFLPNIVQNKIVEAVVLACIVFHALNGGRIILIEFTKAVERTVIAKYFYVVAGLIVVITIIGLFPLFS